MPILFFLILEFFNFFIPKWPGRMSKVYQSFNFQIFQFQRQIARTKTRIHPNKYLCSSIPLQLLRNLNRFWLQTIRHLYCNKLKLLLINKFNRILYFKVIFHFQLFSFCKTFLCFPRFHEATCRLCPVDCYQLGFSLKRKKALSYSILFYILSFLYSPRAFSFTKEKGLYRIP